MSRRSGTGLWLALVPLALSGCMTWQSASRAPTSPVWRDLPGTMRVTLVDGRTLTIERPVFRMDQTIRSERGGPSAALLDISTVEVRQLSEVRTFGLLLVKASGILQIIALVVDSQPHYHGLY